MKLVLVVKVYWLVLVLDIVYVMVFSYIIYKCSIFLIPMKIYTPKRMELRWCQFLITKYLVIQPLRHAQNKLQGSIFKQNKPV